MVHLFKDRVIDRLSFQINKIKFNKNIILVLPSHDKIHYWCFIIPTVTVINSSQHDYIYEGQNLGLGEAHPKVWSSVMAGVK